MTKQDMRKGRNTGWPVSKQSGCEYGREAIDIYQGAAWSPLFSSPSIFLGSLTSPGPACMMIRASSHVRGLKKRRKGSCGLQRSMTAKRVKNDHGIPTTPATGEAAASISSPRIRYLGRLFHSAPVGIEVILRGGEVAVSWKGGRHGSSTGLMQLPSSSKSSVYR